MINLKRIIAFIWTIILFIGLMLPSKGLPNVHIHFIDKVIHFSCFALLTYLWLISSVSPKKLLISASLFALGTELCQKLFTFDRSFEWLDLLFDFFGIFFILKIDNYLHKTKLSKSTNR